MPTQEMPYIEVSRATTETEDPTRADYGPYMDVTTEVVPGKLTRRSSPSLDFLTLATRPDNTDKPNISDHPQGVPENPLFLSDDLVKITMRPNGKDTAPIRVLFEGFVVTPGIDLTSIQAGVFEERQELECYGVAMRLQVDKAAQVYGQYHVDPDDVGTPGDKLNRVLAFGAGPPSYGQAVFNPDGRPNRDSLYFYDAINAGTVQTVGWISVPLFTWADATGSTHWTFADAFRYVLGHYNDEAWVTNGAFDSSSESSPFDTLAEFSERVPDGFTINGMSVLEALAELSAAAGLTMAIEVDEDSNDAPAHQLKFWSVSAGRRDVWAHCQERGDILKVLIGDENDANLDGTNVRSVRWMPDLNSVQNSVVGLGSVEKFTTTINLVPAWTYDVGGNPQYMPSSDIAVGDQAYTDRYVINGSEFWTGDYRKVFRLWAANMDGNISTDGFNNAATAPDFTTLFGYPPLNRPRPFGRIPVAALGESDPAASQPIVEWRGTVSGAETQYIPLKGVPVKWDPERDTLWIAAPDLSTIQHPVAGKSFWQAAMDATFSGGTLAMRITCELSGDRRLISQPTKATTGGTRFPVGRIYDYLNFRLDKVDDLANVSDNVPGLVGQNDQTVFDTWMGLVRDSNTPGPGSGSIVLLPFDDWYKVGDRMLGLRGGRSLSFQKGTTSAYPSVVAVVYDFRAQSVELALGDIRRALRI